MAQKAPPKPPSELSTRSRKLWRSVASEFEMSDAEVELLRNALLALDRADEAATAITEHGIVVKDRYGSLKSNPACDIEARNRSIYARLVAQLGVKLDGPPSPVSERARRAANARWQR